MFAFLSVIWSSRP